MTLEFKQLHVVSDLHIGGEKGFQIFDQGEKLAALIGHLERLTEKKPRPGAKWRHC